MRPSEVVRRAAGYLERHDVESPLANAEVLLAEILETDRAGMYTRADALSTQEAKRFGRALCRRCAGTPTQHLTGRSGFRGLELAVRPGVFIPRPETEVVVDAALSLIRDRPAPLVADVGTGSGAIALAIKHERPDARVMATDLSPDAIALADENAVALDLPVEILLGELLAPLPVDVRGRLDLVVSNPPYVEAAELATLPREVLADPSIALLGGPSVYDRLFEEAAIWLRPLGAIAVEIAEHRADIVSGLARSASFEDVRVDPDLAGRDRIVTGRTPPSASR